MPYLSLRNSPNDYEVAKSIEIEFNFTDNESFLFDDPYYDHPIQYEFVAHKNKKENFQIGEFYDISLYLININPDKIIKGFIYSDIEVSYASTPQFESKYEDVSVPTRGDFYYLRYKLAPDEKMEIVLINRVVYGKSVIKASINFWEGPHFEDLESTF